MITASSHDLSATAWSFAKRALDHNPAMHSISAPSIRKLDEPSDFAHTPWAFAHFQLPVRPLFDAISSKSLRMLSDFATRALTAMLWAGARISVKDGPFFTAIAAQSIAKIRE